MGRVGNQSKVGGGVGLNELICSKPRTYWRGHAFIKIEKKQSTGERLWDLHFREEHHFMPHKELQWVNST